MRETSPRATSSDPATRPEPLYAGPPRRQAAPAPISARPALGLLALATLLVSALAASGARAQSSPPGTAGVAPDAATSPPDAVLVVPRMPRPGSSRAFEHGGAPHMTAEQRFEAANTTRDGHLTESQAQAAHLRGVATHFAEIDRSHRGYITFDEILTWRAERKAAREKARSRPA